MLHLREELPVTMRMPLQRGVADLLRPLVRDLRDGDVVLFRGLTEPGCTGSSTIYSVFR